MKNYSLLSFLSALLLFTTLSAAFPWPEIFGNKLNGVLLARQEEQSSSAASNTRSNSASQTASASNSQPGDNDNQSETASGSGSGSATGSASRTGSASGSATGTASGSGRVSGTGARGNSTRTAVDPRLPPGGVQMMTPAPTAGMTFIKVGEQVTFAWNYTSLSNPPAYVDVVATNTINSQTYTIAANTSWESTQSVVWDTGDYTASNTLPFVVATYTLMVYDAASEPTTIPSAGYLGAFSNLQFGIYTKQPYVPLNEFRCATCSGAMSIHEKQALSVLLGTCVVTVASFTWFASSFGIF